MINTDKTGCLPGSSYATRNPNNIIKEFFEDIENLRMAMNNALRAHDYDGYAKLLFWYTEMINIAWRIW